MNRLKKVFSLNRRAPNRWPTKQNALCTLLRGGLDVKTILDVGVQHETLQLREVFPKLKHLLFEPVEEYYPFINKNYRGYDYELVRAALSDRNGEDYLTVAKMDSDTITHASLDGTLGGEVTEVRAVKTITLDTFLRNGDFPKPYLLKLDVDGHELPILKGAEETLKNTSCVVIESPLYHLVERVAYLESKGFYLWDVVDLCYYYNNLHQLDLIFISSTEKQKSSFSPWQNFKVDMNQWKEFSQFF